MAATKNKITLSQVLEIVGRETKGPKHFHQCPLCHEWHLDVKEKGGEVLVKCWTEDGKKHTKGEVWKHIASKINGNGDSVPQRTPESEPASDPEPTKRRSTGFTPADYAKAKGLPQSAVVDQFQVCEITYYDGMPAVAFPYGIFEGDKWTYTGIHIRLSAEQRPTHWGVIDDLNWLDRKLEWHSPKEKDGEKVRLVPYGLFRLQRSQRMGQGFPKDLVICEGESDVHTFAAYNIAALGISGTKCWKPEFADIDVIRNADRIFIVKEKPVERSGKPEDKSGHGFVQLVGKDLAKTHPDKVFVLDFASPLLDVKDPNLLHLKFYTPGQQEEPPRIELTEFNSNAAALKAEIETAQMTAQGYWEFRSVAAFLEAFNAAVDEVEPFKPFRQYPATDGGNSERFVESKYGKDVCCVEEDKKLAIWRPKEGVWVRKCENVLLLNWARDVAQSITPESILVEDDVDKKWRKRSDSPARWGAMVAGLWGMTSLRVRAHLFDRYLMKLNVGNGTIDLETQQRYDWTREDYETRQVPVLYDKDAKCPKFDAFLERTFGGDRDLIRWMLKALGYSLTGQCSEQCFFVCLGPGGTGKSTLLDLMDKLLGPDYAEPADLAIFDKNSSGKFANAQSYEVTTYYGKRFVHASEPRKGLAVEFEESVIKKLTGGERVKSRMIYEKPMGFYPEMKLWFSMNHKPVVDPEDAAMLRRLLIIPFECKVENIDDKASQDYAEKLVKAEAPGILNRLLEGLGNWCAEGLEKSNLPHAITVATGDYRVNKHVLGRFFAERCGTSDPSQFERAGYLQAAYQQWAKEVGIHPRDGKGFAAELKRRGFEDVRGDNSSEKGSGTIWYGLRLREPYRREAEKAAKVTVEPDMDD